MSLCKQSKDTSQFIGSNIDCNRAFGFPLCSHPTIRTVFDSLMRDNVRQSTTFLQGVTGVEQPVQMCYHVLLQYVEPYKPMVKPML